MTALHTRLAEYNGLLETRLRSLLDRDSAPYGPLYSMMAYHFGWLDESLRPCFADAGKRIRPALCFIASESVGASASDALPGAVAVELLHNFSLIHDDIEDNSPLRRHRSTVWKVWGVPQAVNVGDGMFALAHLALIDEVTDARMAVRAVQMLDRTATELCEGQFLDLHYQGTAQVTLADYLTMVRQKTAAMFGCAVELGALLGGAPDRTVAGLGRFARALGVAFQMRDDISGTWGDQARIGKAATDVRDRKRSLAAVLAWERARDRDLATLSDLYLQPGPLSDSEVSWVLDLYQRLGVREQAELMTDEEFARAGELLNEFLPAADAARHLRQLTEWVANQSGSSAGANGSIVR